MLNDDKLWQHKGVKTMMEGFGENLTIDPYLHLEPLQKELSIRRYSKRTIKSYMRYNRDFLLFTGKKPEEIEDEDIKKNTFTIWLSRGKFPHQRSI